MEQIFDSYQNDYLFSVPYFAPTQVKNSYQASIYSTASNSEIYIYKEECLSVCLSVCLFFMHLNTVRPNAMKFCTGYPFDQGKVIGYFLTQNFHLKGVFTPLIVGFTIVSTFPGNLCMRLLLNSSRTKVYKRPRFLPLGSKNLMILKKK
jgi:hypothetical protein